MVYYEIPRVQGFRLAIGGLALCMMVGAELIGGVVLYERGVIEWVWETDPLAASVGGLVLLAFGLMPWALMAVERADRDEVETYHGHEGKDVRDAVPVVAMTEKSEELKKEEKEDKKTI